MITGSFPPEKCGVGDYTFHLVKNLACYTDSEIFVITTKKKSAITEEKVKNLHILRMVNKWNFDSVNIIISQTKEINPDVVHIQYPTSQYGKSLAPHFLPLILKYIYNLKVVETWHEPLSWKGLFRYLPNVLVRDTLVVVLSNYLSYIPYWYRFLLKAKNQIFVPISSNIPSVVLTPIKREKIRDKFIKNKSQRLICYFGFVSPEKGVDRIFDICDPSKDFILLLCALNPSSDKYHKIILDRANSVEWREKYTVTGYLESLSVSEYLAASDTAIFPFVNGVTERNGSVLAARDQGTFVLTTSNIKKGLSLEENIFYSSPNDIENLRIALNHYSGNKIKVAQNQGWENIARKHYKIYTDLKIKNLKDTFS
jgi:glycosyltransferase involved in cell wall biosynthesis